jgi:hypothetical protein
MIYVKDMLKTGFSFDISILLYTFAHVNNKTKDYAKGKDLCSNTR